MKIRMINGHYFDNATKTLYYDKKFQREMCMFGSDAYCVVEQLNDIFGEDEYAMKLYTRKFGSDDELTELEKSQKAFERLFSKVTYDNMRIHISMRTDGKSLMTEFDTEMINAKKNANSPYKHMTNWFMEKCPEYAMGNKECRLYLEELVRQHNEKKAADLCVVKPAS